MALGNGPDGPGGDNRGPGGPPVNKEMLMRGPNQVFDDFDFDKNGSLDTKEFGDLARTLMNGMERS